MFQIKVLILNNTSSKLFFKVMLNAVGVKMHSVNVRHKKIKFEVEITLFELILHMIIKLELCMYVFEYEMKEF